MSGTTHNSPKSGHGPKIRRQRYAWPAGLRKGVQTRAERMGYAGPLKATPWLKGFGSRPENKRPGLERAA